MNNNSKWSKLKRVGIVLIDLVVFNLSIIASFIIKFGFEIPEYNWSAYQGSFIWITITFLVLNLLFSTYIFYNKSYSDIVFITVLVQVLTIIAIMTVTFAGRWFSFPRSVLVISFFLGIIMLSIWRLIAFHFYLKVSGTQRVMVVGNKEKVFSAVQNFENAKNNRHKVIRVVIDNYLENVEANIEDIDIIYLANSIDEKEKLLIYELVIRSNKKLFINTSFDNLIVVRPNMMNFEDESIIEVSDFKITSEEALLKRMIDIVVSLALLVIVSPILLITAVLVKVTSKGPVIYKQIRITLDGKEFGILKFRTMGATAEAKSGPVLATANDTRITPIGKYLRALRIDELPQLLNVLKGDMSLVGPRPERPFFVNQFEAENPYYYIRHNVRAGITGYAQVYGKYASDFNSKLNFDLLYIKNYSLVLDIKIMLQTTKILFDKMSSKGLDEQEAKSYDETDLAKKEIQILH